MKGPIQFFAWVIRLAIGLALIGQLKTCTLTMMGLAAENTQRGIMSYSKFTRMLMAPPGGHKNHKFAKKLVVPTT